MTPFKRYLLPRASALPFAMLGLLAAGAAAAQDTQANAAKDAQPEQVVVTGTRISKTAAGPNPITSLTSDELGKLSVESLPAALAKLPQFQPIKSSDSASDGGYQPTGNYLDLLGLGPIRTLVLEDGHRVPQTYYDGTVDINTLPQMLVKRVEVVTGGASAVYGSDAVSGVANFILDKTFNGLEGQVQGGQSTYGDAKSYRFGFAGGGKVLDRGHFEWSADLYNRNAVVATPRAYGTASVSIVGTGTAASPLVQVENSRLNTSSFGGLVTTGPFAGEQFAPDGTLVAFNKGTATNSAAISTGGDGGYYTPSNLLPRLRTDQLFGRFDYAFSDTVSGYVQATSASSNTLSHEQNLISTASSNGLTIYSGNAYLLPQYQTVLTNTKTASFNLARYNEDFANRLALSDGTELFSVTAGLTGKWRDRFSWEAWYTHADTQVSQLTTNNINTERLYAAIDAVKDQATGNIVCRVTLTAPNAFPGCVPMNILGNGPPSQAAIDYVSGSTSWTAENHLDDLGANISGTLFQGWAGPIKAAVGAEYRMQSLTETTSVLDNTFSDANLRVGLNGTTPSAGALLWTKNITAPAHGAESVYESDIEVDVPLLRDVVLAKTLSVSGAARYTHYSISGDANTWRLGLTWQPVSDLTFTATRSRDIRAPTLYDLFQGQSGTISGATDYLTGASGQVINVSQGNRDLVPEVARNITAGVTYRPSWLPHFSTGFDYFQVNIDNAIASVTGDSATTEKLCIASGGTSPLCDLVVRPYPITNTTAANYPTLNYIEKENIAKAYAKGFDVHLDYASELSDIAKALKGAASVRVLWTHEPVLKSQALPGAVVTNTAGTASAPVDRVNITLGYGLGAFGASVTARYFSPFHYSADPTLVSDVPVSDPYEQVDANLTYDFKVSGYAATGFVNVNNLFNAHGGLYEASAANPGLIYPAAPFADEIGRYVTVGVRFRMR